MISVPEYIHPPAHLTEPCGAPDWVSGGTLADLGAYSAISKSYLSECSDRMDSIRLLEVQ